MSAPRKLTDPLTEEEGTHLFGRIHRSPRIPDRYAAGNLQPQAALSRVTRPGPATNPKAGRPPTEQPRR